jgi:hypothetical protein
MFTLAIYALFKDYKRNSLDAMAKATHTDYQKLQIAKELFDTYSEMFDLSGIVFDSWYAATYILEHIHARKKIFFSEIKSNRNIFMYHPIKKTKCCVKPDELVTLIKKYLRHKLKSIQYQTSDGSEVSYKTYSFAATLKDCEVPIKFVVVPGKWNNDDDNTYYILITNKLNASDKTILTNYLLRWGIERCFKELKDTFYFDHYEVRHIDKVERYWNLVRLSSRRSLSHCLDCCLLDQAECLPG